MQYPFFSYSETNNGYLLQIESILVVRIDFGLKSGILIYQCILAQCNN